MKKSMLDRWKSKLFRKQFSGDCCTCVEKKRDQEGITFLLLFIFCLMGLCDTVGMAACYMQTDFMLSDVQTAVFPFSVFVWFLFLPVPVCRFADVNGWRGIALFGVLVMMTGLVLPVLIYNVTGCVIAFSLIGIGSVLLYVSFGTLMFPTVEDGIVTVPRNFGWMIKTVSSFCVPFLSAVFGALWGKWQLSLCLFVCLSFPVVLRIISSGRIYTISFPIIRFFKKSIILRKYILTLFLMTVSLNGMDVGMNIVVPQLLVERCGNTAQEAALGSGFYLICKAFGLLMGTVWRTRMNSRRYSLFWLSVIVCSIFFLCFVRGEEYGILSLSGMVGVGSSLLFIKIHEMAFKDVSDSGRMMAVLMLMAMCGGAFIPLFMGVASVIGSQIGSLSVLLVCTGYIAVTFCMERNLFN